MQPWQNPQYCHLNWLSKFVSQVKFDQINQVKFPFLQWRLQHWFVQCWNIKIQALLRICTFDLVVFCWTVLWDTSIPCTCRWLKAALMVCTALYWWKVVSAAIWQLQYNWHPDFEVLAQILVWCVKSPINPELAWVV